MLARSRHTLARTTPSLPVAPTVARASSRPLALSASSQLRRIQLSSCTLVRALTTTSPQLRHSHSKQPDSRPTRACPSCSAPIPLSASPCPACSALIPIPPGLSLHSLLEISDPIPTNTGAGAKEAVGSRNPGDGAMYDIRAELSRLPAHGYDLEPRSLRNEMLKRQALLHPDRHGSGDVDLAAELSGRVNKAYEVLANPQTRAEYILEQYGLDTKETDHVADHDLLLEILEARESLEEATPEEVEELRDENHKKVVDLTQRITHALSKEPPELEKAKDMAVELKYWVGLEHAAKERL